MSTRQNSPSLVVVAHPRKTRYNRKKSQPVPSEQAASQAVEAYEDAVTDEVELDEAPRKAANG